MRSFTRRRGPAAGGVVAQAIAAIENALLDAKAKALGVPCYVLLGGKLRDRIPLYWSHCATWRINHATYYKPEIKDLDGVKAIGREVREKGFLAAKTNIFIYEDGKNPRGWRPGFGSPYYPELNIDTTVLRNLHMHLEALRDGLRPRSRPAARSQLQRQDRRLSEDPAQHRRHRHVLGRDRHLLAGSARLHPPGEPASDLVLRDAARPCASSSPTSTSRRWMSRSSTRRGTACGSR